MTFVLVLGVLIALGSFGGSAYLLALWHEDAGLLRASGTRVSWRIWPFSRVLAYLSIGSTLASNLLAFGALIRIANVANYHEIQIALTPLTLIALLFLDSVFLVIAAYLRLIRRQRKADGDKIRRAAIKRMKDEA